MAATNSLSLILSLTLLCNLISFTLTQPPPVAPQSPPPPIAPRPSADDEPRFARWLVSQSSWGVLATLGQDNSPFSNIISFADGDTGTPYFYISPIMDPTGMDAVRDSRASFALSEAILGFSPDADPQSPKCAKLTLSGNLQLLANGTAEAEFGQDALFQKHPQLKGFPLQTMKFNVFKMVINNISLVTKPAPRVYLTLDAYFQVKT